ncbi:MAG: hypothetical protein ACRDRN_20820, partial [Sciscionella sp.]
MELSVDEIEQILAVFLDSDIQEIHIEFGDVTVMASKRKQAGEDAVARERARPARVSQPSRSAERAVRQPSAVRTPPAGEASGSPDRDGLVA